MTLGKPKNWGEVLAMLTVLGMFAGLIALAQDTNRIARDNQRILADRGSLIDEFSGTFQDIRDILDDIQEKQDDNLLEVIMVNESEGFILQRLPEKHGGKTITIPFNKYPPVIGEKVE